MGGSLHNRPSPDWWSVPSAKRIGQPTRAEPMERSTPTKILRLAPDSVFVSFLCPFFYLFQISYLVFLSFSPLFSPKPLGACLRVVRTYLTRHPRSLYLGASLSEVYINGPHAQNICVAFPYVPFLHHYMHRYDLSFGQAGLPGSCVYALRSR